MNVMYFVVQFRRSRQLLVDFVRFDNLITAVESLRNAERVNKDDDLEIVLLSSSSEEMLRRTHSRYFGGFSALAFFQEV
jgi:hypothetical protein